MLVSYENRFENLILNIGQKDFISRRITPLLHKYPNMKKKPSFLNRIEAQQVQFQDKQATGVEWRRQLSLPQTTGSVSIESKSNYTNNTTIDFSMLDIKIKQNYLSRPMDLYMLSKRWNAAAVTVKNHFQASTNISRLPVKLNAFPFWKHDSIDSSYIVPTFIANYICQRNYKSLFPLVVRNLSHRNKRSIQ